MVEGISGILEGWLIVGVTARHSEHTMHWTRHALYQGPKPNRPQGNPGLLHSSTKLCWRSWRIIHVMDMNHHLIPEVFYGVHILSFGMTHPWVLQPGYTGKSLVARVVWGRALLWTRKKLFHKGALAQGKRLCCSTHLCICWFMVPSSTTSSLLPSSWNHAHMMSEGPTSSVPCTQTPMCLSQCRLHTRDHPLGWCNLNLDSSVKIQWWMSKTQSWCLAHWRWCRQCT